MKYWLEGEELVVKNLFVEKRYSFQDVTRVNFEKCIAVYIDDKCILNVNKNFQDVIVQYDIYHLAEKYGFVIEDCTLGEEEISIFDVHAYVEQIREKMQNLFEEYVKQELGEDYEFVISTDETAFHIRMFFDIYRNGEKLSIPDERERQCYFDWENGKKKMHLVWIHLVETKYANPKMQEYKLTKRVNFEDNILEIKRMISKMKKCGVVLASQYED